MNMRIKYADKVNSCKKPKFVFLVENICDYIIDWYFHVDTTKVAKLIEHDNKINYMYEPFSYRKLHLLFKKYPFQENDGFIDIGCGKGRVLIQALLHGCKNIYGIDISKELLECASNNMQECKKKNSKLHYELLYKNAKDYVFSEDINKIFLYNPFNFKILFKVLKTLVYSIERKPRKVTIFIAGPANILKFMDKVKDFKLIAIEQKNIYVYQSVSK